MGMERAGRLTTEELLGRLERRGLGVTRNMLGQDVKAGYLPELVMDPRGPSGGIGRWWEPWAAERAVYLYRLRRRGGSGDLLRVLLFLRDGRGWEDVKPICLTGLGKLIGAQGRRVTGRLRSPSPRALHHLVEDFAEGEFASEQVARFVWGIGFFGLPLPGGSLRPLLDTFRTVYELEAAPEVDHAAEQLVARVGRSWPDVLAMVEASDETEADAARHQLLSFFQWFRGRQHAYLVRHGQRGWSANPVTLFGCPPDRLHALCRSLPGRPTPAQLLASWLGPMFLFTVAAPALKGELARTKRADQEQV